MAQISNEEINRIVQDMITRERRVELVDRLYSDLERTMEENKEAIELLGQPAPDVHFHISNARASLRLDIATNILIDRRNHYENIRFSVASSINAVVQAMENNQPVAVVRTAVKRLERRLRLARVYMVFVPPRVREVLREAKTYRPVVAPPAVPPPPEELGVTVIQELGVTVTENSTVVPVALNFDSDEEKMEPDGNLNE